MHAHADVKKPNGKRSHDEVEKAAKPSVDEYVGPTRFLFNPVCLCVSISVIFVTPFITFLRKVLLERGKLSSHCQGPVDDEVGPGAPHWRRARQHGQYVLSQLCAAVPHVYAATRKHSPAP